MPCNESVCNIQCEVFHYHMGTWIAHSLFLVSCMAESRESEPQQPGGRADRVSWNQLVAYGMGGMIPIALFNIAGQLIGLLGNISLGLSAFWLGAILMVPRLWDAVSDPIVGYLSDNTRTAWGRRRPFILAGGIAVAVSFVVMWWVPEEETLTFLGDAASQWLRLLFILATVLAFYTACTLFEIPHGALGHGDDQRSP